MSPRLELAVASGVLPREGRVLLIGAPAGLDTEPLGALEITIEQEMMPDADWWSDKGFEPVRTTPCASHDAAVVFLPRSRQAGLDRIARAAAAAPIVLVDGQKTDGIDSVLKAVRTRATVDGVLSKSHGKIFRFRADGTAFADWLRGPTQIDGGWHVAPGVFSADGVDPGSALLAAVLPVHLTGRVADLGAGWGYLAASALAHCPGITELHLVEAQASALDCARRNVLDPRARFHWADATDWTAERDLDVVVMNPPFHTGRTADTGVGRAFIASAARILRSGGTLWMVANRHLGYEQPLRRSFGDVTEIGGDTRYKLLRAVALPRKRR